MSGRIFKVRSPGETRVGNKKGKTSGLFAFFALFASFVSINPPT
jgi:hypothetical protein